MEKVDHILRSSLPWREASLTECGKKTDQVSVITRETFKARLKELGPQRASLFTCMTCSQAVHRHPSWADDPRWVMHREIVSECGSYPGLKKSPGPMLYELVAIQDLIKNHADEFDEILARGEWRRRSEGRNKHDR